MSSGLGIRIIRYGKRNTFAESPGLDKTHDHTGYDPYTAGYLSLNAQVDPDHEAKNKSDQGRNYVDELPALFLDKKMNKYRQINTHKCNKSPEIQHFCGQLKIEDKNPGKGSSPNE
jgi:hypothetical protein